MQVRIGSYLFAANSVYVGVRQSSVLNAAEIPYLDVVEVDCSGRLFGTSQSDLTTKELALEAALNIPFQNFALLQDSGVPSAINLVSAQTLGGVQKVRGPDFVSRYGAEYAVQREFSFTMRAVYPIENVATALVSFQETMQYDGGGPEYIERPAVNGPSQIHLGWAQKAYTLQQSGEAVGFLAYPTPPPPAYLPLRVSPKYTRGSPQRIGNKYVRYPIRWEYSMLSNTPIIALPTLWR